MKGAVIESCEVTEAHLYLKVINRKMKAEVAVNDVVQAGFVISNSEVGLGHLTVEPLIYRLVCKNGMIVKDYSQGIRNNSRAKWGISGHLRKLDTTGILRLMV